MLKSLHSELQEELVQLGRKLGFQAISEYSVENLYPGYSPRIDIVWFYPLSKEQSSAIRKVYSLWPYWQGSRALYPYAAFEITSLDATSKTIMSEIWNLTLAGFRYSFNIVPEKNPEHPDYMHKERALRIAETLQYFSETIDAFIISINEIQNALYKMKNLENNEIASKKSLNFKVPHLKNTPHDTIVKEIMEFGKNYGFISVAEYTPEWLKKLGKRVTFIRHNVAWLLELPVTTETKFKKFLEFLGTTAIRNISPVEVLAFEVELGAFNKHSIGSVLNIAKITGRGVVVVENKHQKLLETVRVISSNRVDIKTIEEVIEV